jgi:hypothetical protein
MILFVLRQIDKRCLRSESSRIIQFEESIQDRYSVAELKKEPPHPVNVNIPIDWTCFKNVETCRIFVRLLALRFKFRDKT